MPPLASRKNLLRTPNAHGHHRVTHVELFFDLVFVFAITQLSHSLVEHLSLIDALRTGLLLMAVWWAWMYTSWATNWLDPERASVRLMLFGLMLAGLLMSSAAPKAFENRGLAFALAYVAIQIGRTLFVLWALRAHSPVNFRNFQRIAAWFALGAVFWIAGGLADGWTRFALWTLAIGIDYAAPTCGFWTPFMGRSATTDWNIEGGHMAERCALFIIIALGESILVTGATLARQPDWTLVNLAAFTVAVCGSIAMWWIYFNIGAEAGSHRIANESDPGRMARAAYTYIHLPIVAGIVVMAVGDELVLAHPTGPTDVRTAATVAGGPALYLVGNILFKRVTANRWPLSHLIGLGCIAAIVLVTSLLSPLAFAAAAAASLALVAVWETLSLRGAGHVAGEVKKPPEKVSPHVKPSLQES